MPCWDKLADGQTDRQRQTKRDRDRQTVGQSMTTVNRSSSANDRRETTIVTYALVTKNKLCAPKFKSPPPPTLSLSLTKVQYFFNFYKVFTNSPSLPLFLTVSSADIIEAHKNQQLCSLTGVEGGHSLGGSLAVLRTLYAIGVRYMTLTSTCHTPWADSSSADAPTFNMKHGGLTIFGKVSLPTLSLSLWFPSRLP